MSDRQHLQVIIESVDRFDGQSGIKLIRARVREPMTDLGGWVITTEREIVDQLGECFTADLIGFDRRRIVWDPE